ncbi:unnamed protein product [Peniophora sp. CBMAI 1063]|nr:unnamed protein product [Peniophora sp. CBMAI 1063]
MPAVEASPAYYLQCVGTQTFLTISSDGKCTANTKDNSDAQKWYFDARAGDVAIHNKASGTYLSFPSLASGQRMACSEQTASPKIYQLVAPGEACDQYHIAVQGKADVVLDVSGSDKKSGTAVLLYSKHGGKNQVWAATLADQ